MEGRLLRLPVLYQSSDNSRREKPEPDQNAGGTGIGNGSGNCRDHIDDEAGHRLGLMLNDGR